ncbi:DUF3857 and transglutaminase domain-containing protein [Acidovorax sp.]|uniref:DUF3857 domain-containing transglutaminase family protein n=1 Tax=Acidovorax sp. TaxID=1872122 RepID=UPI0026193B80|nr:DUF3857 and transglutaminase domain-containing protein [Acidovorax sp.]
MSDSAQGWRWHTRGLLAGIFALSCVGAVAQSPDTSSVPVVSKQWHTTYDVAADGKSSVTYATVNQIVHASALERMKSFSFSYSSSIQQGQIVEAFTEKPDGRRIVVPPNNYQTEVSDGRDGNKPMFSDRSRISVVFPDVAVGDSVGVTYKIDDKVPMFPGAFSTVQSFSPYGVHQDTRITIRAPIELKLRVEVHDLQEQPAVAEGETAVRQWRYQNLTPRKWDEADSGIWRLEEKPVLLASTFPDYESIAKAYGDRALPKAQPTPRIQALAESIVGKQITPRERARLLYEWVSTNITYGGNCIGVGAVVPRDLDVVLDNKMGDCKDHATLLQALLAAAGVRSEQVLINAGSLYDLPATPVVSTVNHVINYLPDFGLYADATAKQIPFGYLPEDAYAKPVIHVRTDKALAQVPAGDPRNTEQRMHMTLKLAANGSATGTLRADIKGAQAAYLRNYMRNLQGDGERDFVRKVLSGSGFKGKGTLDKGDISDAKLLSDQYGFNITFDIDNYLPSSTQGAFSISPVVSLPLSISRLAGGHEDVTPRRRSTCFGYSSYEVYELELAPGVTFTKVPANLRLRQKVLNFSSSYQRTKTGFKVIREVKDSTLDGVCSVESLVQWNTEVKPIAENLQEQIFYKRKAR